MKSLKMPDSLFLTADLDGAEMYPECMLLNCFLIYGVNFVVGFERTKIMKNNNIISPGLFLVYM